MERTSVSKVVRKPWGGDLEAEIRTSTKHGPDLFAVMADGCRKLAELSLMAALVAVPLIYMFQQDPLHLEAIINFINSLQLSAENSTVTNYWNGLIASISTDTQPFFSALMPTLETKFSSWFVLGSIMIMGYVGVRVVEGISRRSFLGASDQFAEEPGKRNWIRLIPLICIASFLIYSLASFLLWPPPIPADASALIAERMSGDISPLSRFMMSLGGGGFFYSMVAWLQISFALVFFLVCEDLFRDRPMVNKVLGLIVLTGVLNSLVMILVKVQFEPLMQIWVKIPSTESRNNLGGFIGHNTGVSSFLMAPILLLLSYLLGQQPNRSTVFRLGATLMLLMMALTILLAQSRAVIPILLICGIALIVLLALKSCLVKKSRLFVALPVGVALIIITQIVSLSSPKSTDEGGDAFSITNPLFREDVTLVERIGEFHPSRLRTETRLRIFWISITQLVPQRLIGGHGWASFQYVYPTAAGEFFERFPATALAPTALRTPQAHNEYLQLLIETGIIGSAIALVGLFFLLRSGWLAFNRSLFPHHIATQLAVFLSIIALLIHCLFDFPLRIPPLALTLVVFLAIWNSGNRLWVFRLRPATDEIGDTAIPIPDSSISKRPEKVSKVVWKVHALAVLTGIILLVGAWGAALGVARLISPFQSHSTFVTAGQAFLNQFARSGGRDKNSGDNAFGCLSSGRRIYWIEGEVNRLLATARQIDAIATLRAADDLARNGRTQEAAQTRGFAVTKLSGALSDLNQSLLDEQNHLHYFTRYTILQQMAENSPVEKRKDYDLRAFVDLQKSAAMNPGDRRVLLELIQNLERSDWARNRTMIVRLMGTLNYFHPEYFRSMVFQRVLDSIAFNETEQAARLISAIVEAVGAGFLEPVSTVVFAGRPKLLDSPRPPSDSDDDLRLGLGSVALYTKQYDVSRSTALAYIDRDEKLSNPLLKSSAIMMELMAKIADASNRYRAMGPDDARSLLADTADLKRNWQVDENNILWPTIISLQYLICQTNPGQPAELCGESESRVRTAAEASHFLASIVADFAERLFNNPQLALEWMELRRTLPKGKPMPLDALDFARLSRLYIQLNQFEKLEVLVPDMEAHLSVLREDVSTRGDTRPEQAKFQTYRRIVREAQVRVSEWKALQAAPASRPTSEAATP